MDCGPLLPGMVDTVGGLLPALISLGMVAAGGARCGVGRASQILACVLSVGLSVALAEVEISPEAISLHFPPGAAAVLCYLVWRGHYISPCLGFAFTYASMLAVDVWLARLVMGPDFNAEGIGGACWRDGLLVLPTLTALAIVYANWRLARVGRAGLLWFGQKAGGRAPKSRALR